MSDYEEDRMKELSQNSKELLKQRYCYPDEEPEDVFDRVAEEIGSVRGKTGEYRKIMKNLDFMPNSPTLFNAGVSNALSACYVIPIHDNIESIFKAVSDMGEIQTTGGGCVHKGSRIFTSHHGVEKIDGLYNGMASTRGVISDGEREYINIEDEKIKTPSLDKEKAEIGFETIEKIWKYDLEKDETLLIEGEGALKSKVSNWHPFFIFDGENIIEKRADEITEGDLLVLPNESITERWPYRENREIQGIEIDADIGWLIGIFLSEGHIDDGGQTGLRVRIHNTDEKVINKALSILEEKTGIEYTPYTDPRNNRVSTISIYDQRLTKVLRKLNRNEIGSKANEVRIPEEIFKSPLGVVGSFLAGYIDGDGHLQKKKKQIDLDSSSYELSQDLSSLLYLLGIKSRFRRRKEDRKKEWKDIFEVSISGNIYIQKILKYVKDHLVIEHKKRRILKHAEESHSTVSCSIPFNVFEPLLNEIGIDTRCTEFWRESQEIGDKKFYLGNWRGKEQVSKKKVLSIIEEMLEHYSDKMSENSLEKIKKWYRIIPSAIPVTSIYSDCEGGEFYDLTVSNKSNYFAGKNGLSVIHNTGFNFSNLREKGAPISGGGKSTGALSFMRIFDQVTNAIRQGGRRRGASMGILDYDHPEIINFIKEKITNGTMKNFNLSIMATDDFMEKVKNDERYILRSRYDGSIYTKMRARDLFKISCYSAWLSADPGFLFKDRINEDNDREKDIVATNPCVTGNTLIYTRDGVKRIEDMVDDNYDIKLDNRLSEINSKKITPFCTGRKKVFNLKTEEGFELNVTKDHKIKTANGWKKAGQLEKNDKIWIGKMSNSNEEGGSINSVAEYQKGLIFGWLTGDGCISGGGAILSFHDRDRELSSDFLEAAKELLKNKNISKLDREYSLSVINREKKNKDLIKSVRLMRLLKNEGLGDKEKVPERILMGGEDIQRGYLKSLFTADGYVSIKEDKKSYRISLAQSNKALLKDIQRMLLNFGIFSRLYEDRRKRDETEIKGETYDIKKQHELTVSKDNLLRFQDRLGFLRDDKKESLDWVIKNYEKGPYSEKYLARFSELEEIGERKVYDIQEPLTHSFIANGIVVHNCGELPLLPYDSCTLGSLNLSNFVDNGDLNTSRLKEVTEIATDFLLDVNEVNNFPLEENERANEKYNSIGLGVMGFADALMKLGIKYDSRESYSVIREVGTLMDEVTRRRAPDSFNRTMVAPTGSVSIIADCSSGIEPIYSREYVRDTRSGEYLESREGEYLRTAHEIDPMWHLRIQTKWQEFVTGAVSKTINLPNNASVESVEKIYREAWERGAKGITIYRDESKKEQVYKSR